MVDTEVGIRISDKVVLSLDRISILGCPVDRLTKAETIARIEQYIREGKPRRHGFLNVAKVVRMQTDDELLDTLSSCDLINADGMGIVWASKLLGTPLPERVNGTNLMLQLIQVAAEKGYKVFLLGARPDVIENTRAIFEEQYQDLIIVGTHHGYFQGEEEAVVEQIRQAAPDLLFVGMSTPMKEYWMRDNAPFLNVPFTMGVGGSFDVVAGKVWRAPEWAQSVGMEWLWRLVQEPRRMWRRYLIGNPKFIWLVANQKWDQLWRSPEGRS